MSARCLLDRKPAKPIDYLTQQKKEKHEMIDKTTKLLLATIAGLLCVLIAHDFLGGTPVQAQSPVAAAPSQPVMVADSNVVYILQNGTLSAYILDSPTLEKGLPGVLKQKLRRFSSVKVQTAP